jgi:hypothetical protein
MIKDFFKFALLTHFLLRLRKSIILRGTTPAQAKRDDGDPYPILRGSTPVSS